MPLFAFVFRARVRRIVDGDTLDVEIDQGMNCRHIARIRLLGIDCPEKRGETRAAGLDAMQWVADWCCSPERNANWPLVIQTEKGDAFGRFLAHVWCAKTGLHLNSEIQNAGHAVPYKE